MADDGCGTPAAIPFNGTSINCRFMLSSLLFWVNYSAFTCVCVENVDLLLKNGHNLSAALRTHCVHSMPWLSASKLHGCYYSILFNAHFMGIFSCFGFSTIFFTHFTYLFYWVEEKEKKTRTTHRWHHTKMARWNQSKRMWFVTKSSDSICMAQCA